MVVIHLMFPTLALRVAFFDADGKDLSNGATGLGAKGYRSTRIAMYGLSGRNSAVYPERFAQEALGHNSKAVHRAYARRAQVKLLSLEYYEKQFDAARMNRDAANVSNEVVRHLLSELGSRSKSPSKYRRKSLRASRTTCSHGDGKLPHPEVRQSRF
jgi:hypothetical protein